MQYIEICSLLEQKILEIDDDTYNQITSSNAIQNKYIGYLDAIRSQRDYYLDENSELILCKIQNIANNPSEVYSLFRNMDKKTQFCHTAS